MEFRSQADEVTVKELAEELERVRYRGIRRADQRGGKTEPLSIPTLRGLVSELEIDSGSSRFPVVLEQFLTDAIARCNERDALRALFRLDNPNATPQEGQDQAAKLFKGEQYEARTLQKNRSLLRHELAEMILEIVDEARLARERDGNEDAAGAESRGAGAPLSLEAVQTELQLLREGLGVSVAKIRRHADSIKRLDMTEHEYRLSALSSETEDRSASAYRVLGCATEVGTETASRAVLRRTLNFGESALQLSARRARLAAELGLDEEVLTEFERDVFESFAVYLHETAQSPCRSGQDPPFAPRPTGPLAATDIPRRLQIGLLTLEERDGHRDRLIIEFLDGMPSAREILREHLGNPAPAEAYELLVKRVLRSRWKAHVLYKAQRLGLPAVRSQAEFVLGVDDPWDTGLNDEDQFHILAPQTRELAGDLTTATRRVLDTFARIVERIDQDDDWARVLLPDDKQKDRSRPVPVG